MLPVPELLDLDLLIACAAAAAAGLIRGFAGFGAGLVMAPIFAVLFGPVEMIVIIAIMEIAATIQLLPPAVRDTQWRFVTVMAVCAAVFMPVGSWILVSVDPALLTRVVAAIVVAFALVLMTGWRYRGERRLPITMGVGALSGVMISTTSLGNPPVLLYMLSGADQAATHRANIIAYLAITEAILLVVFLAEGLLGWTALWRALLLTPAFLGSAWLGSRLFRRASEALYRRVALVFLICVGIYVLAR